MAQTLDQAWLVTEAGGQGSFFAQLLKDSDKTFHEKITFPEFLKELHLDDKWEALSELLTEPGAELTELRQMDEDDLREDILDDDDLALSPKTKKQFHGRHFDRRK